MNPLASGAAGEGREAVAFAMLAIVSTTAFMLVLRAVMAVWPVGSAGTVSRIGSVVLLALWVVLRGAGPDRLRFAGVGLPLAVMGLLSIVINVAWFAGMQWTTATVAMLLFRLDLLFVLLIGAALGLERLDVTGWVVLPIMLFGLGLVMEVHRLEWSGRLVGNLLIVLSALGLAVNAFVIRRILERMDAEALAVYNHLFSGAGFVLLLLVEGFSTPAVSDIGSWVWIPALVLTAALSTPLYYAALGRMAVWKLRALMLLTPPLAGIAEWVIWGDVLSPAQWVGAALLVGGAAALVWADWRAEDRPVPAEPHAATPAGGVEPARP